MLSETQLAADALLREAVLQAITSNRGAAIDSLKVGVLNGVVHLAGEAPSLDVWESVERLVGQIRGVRGVVNRIAAPGAPSPSRMIHLDLSSALNSGDLDNPT